MKGFGKRTLAYVLSLIMVMSVVTPTAFATETEPETTAIETVEETRQAETEAPETEAAAPESEKETPAPQEETSPVETEKETEAPAAETEAPSKETEAETPAKETEAETPAKETEEPATESEDPTEPAKEDPTEPAKEDPTEPAKEDPTEPAKEDPTEPAKEDPTEPAKEDPTEPAKEDPTEPAKEDPAEPAKEDPTEPAQEPEAPQPKSFTSYVGKLRVVVRDDNGALPMGTRMKVKEVDVEDLINAAMDGNVKIITAVDISFWYEDEEIEPTGPVSVDIRAAEKAEDIDNVQVLHIDDDNNVTEVEDVTAKQGKSNLTTQFETDEFSIYVVVETGDDARIKVIFMNGDSEIDSMYVKDGDNMEQVLYDPGSGTLADGVYFRGWTADPDYTTATAAKTIAQVRTEVTGMLPPAQDGKEVTYYAMLFKDYRITYLDENGISLGQEEVTFRADSTSAEQSYKVNMAYTVQNENYHFEGWNVAEGASNIKNHTEGTAYQNNETITITGDVTFSVNAPKGHWFIFNENGKGATYNAPQFVYSADKPVRPNDDNMIRNGYTFGGWFEDKAVADQTSGGTQYNFNQTLTDKVTVYARWIPKTSAPYTIIIWRQNLAGNGYDFVTTVSGTGTVGSTINAVSEQGTGNGAYARINGTNYNSNYTLDGKKPFEGFHLKEFDQNVTIKTEGNSVLNVYYDRNEHTLQFQINGQYYEETTGTSGTQYGYYNGQYVRIYYNNGTWYRTRTGSNWGGYSYSNPYNGTRYTQENGWHSIKDITALYGQSISDNFPIVGTNGVTYDQGERWMPQNSSTYNQVLIYIDIMPDEDVVFHLNTATHTTKHIYYYVEALEGETGDTVTYNGKTFVLYKHMAANYGYFTEKEDYLNFVGFSKYGYTPSNAWGSGGASTVYCYYTRNVYTINFMDGEYVNGDGNPLEESGMGQIKTQSGIAYGADTTSFNSYKPDADHTPSGFVFEGWFIDSACTQPYTFTTMPEGGITVYAKWRQKQYRVFLHVNYPEGATGNINWGTTNQAMTFRISEGGHVSEPTGRDLAGFAFDGWYLDKNFTQVFNGEAYAINENTVTTPYDKTVDMTDTYDNNGNLIDPKSNSDATGYNGGDRFWITTKLDIYAKWHSTLEGASGIVVEYNADGGTGAPTDTHTYVDTAKAPAGAASKAPANSGKVFGYWEVQKWNGSAYVGTGTTVLPGDTFTVLKANAKVEDLATPAANGDTKKYTVQLKAVYIDSEQPTPTHIYWYLNNGENAFRKDENIEINVGVDIPDAPTRDGYTFLGWSRVDISTSTDPTAAAAEAAAWEANSDNWIQDLTEPNLITYENGAYKNKATGDAAEQVAADEDRPYHAMFAVWEENEVTINYAVADDSEDMGTVAPTSETIKAVSGTASGSTATAASNMYVFDYWTMDDGTESVGDDVQFVPQQENGMYVAHTYYAHFKLNKAPVTVHHYLKGTTTKVADDVTTQEVIGSEFTATPVTEYQGKTLTPDSYDPGQTVTVSVDGNTITIYYTLPLTITAKTASKEYDGEKLVGEFTISGELEDDHDTIMGTLGDPLEIGPDVTPETEYQAATDGIPSYYAITNNEGTLEITQNTDEVTVTIVGNHDSKVYTGSEQSVEGYTYSAKAGETTVANDEFEVALKEGKEAKASGTDVDHYDMELTKDDFTVTSKNYSNITVVYEDGYLDITPITDEVTVTIVGNHDSKVYTGSEQSVEGYTYSAKAGETTVANDEFEVALKEGKEAKASGTDVDHYDMELTKDDFTVTSKNYSNIKVEYTDGYLDITPTTDELTVTLEDDEYTYDAQPHYNKNEAVTNESGGTTKVEFSKDGETWTEDLTSLTATYVADSFTIQVRATNPNYSNTATTTAKLTIKKAALTITADSNEKEYDGTPLTDNGWQDTPPAGLQGTDAVDSVTVTGTITNVGTEPNVPSSAVVKNGSADVTANYEIEYVNGTLEITKSTKELSVASADGEWTYDAAAHTNKTYTVTYGDETIEGEEGQVEFTLSTGDKVTVTPDAAATITHMSESDVDNAFTWTVTNETFYTKGQDTVGKLTVNPAELTIVTESGEKEYDGEALTAGGKATFNKVDTTLKAGEDVTVALAGTETVKVKITGTQTPVGSSQNTYEITWGDVDEEDYEVKETLGTLNVTKSSKTLKVESADGEWTYDAAAHTNKTYTVTYGDETIEGEEGQVEFTLSTGDKVTVTPDAAATITHVSESDVDNAFTWTVENEAFYTKGQDTVGKLTVNPAELTISTESASKEYDGEALTAPGKATFNKADTALKAGEDVEVALAGTETIKVKITGTQTPVGSSQNTYEITWGNVAEDDYKVTPALGTLTVGKSSKVLKVESADGEWTYDGAAHTNKTYTVTYGDETIEGEEGQVEFTLSTGDKVTVTPDAAATITHVSESDVDNAFTWTVENEAFYTKGQDTVGKLTINPAALTITANDQEYVYNGAAQGEDNATYTDDSKVTVEGLQGEDALTSVTLNGQETNVGEYTGKIVPSAAQIGENTGDYEIEYVAGKLTITKAALTITANDQEYVYNAAPQGEDNKTYTDDSKVTVEGLQGDDALTSITLNGQETNVGEYDGKIVPSAAQIGENTGNYEIEYVAGKLTIKKAILTITANDQGYVYNGAPQGEDNKTYTDDSKVTVDGLKGSDKLTSITLNGQETNVGEYADKIVPSAAEIGEATGNYDIAYEAGKLTITKAALTITANDQEYVYNGAAQGENNATYTDDSKVTVEGLQGSDALTSVTLNGQERNVGEYTGKIVPSAAQIGENTGDYEIEYVAGKLTITKAALTITANDQEYVYNGAAQGENNKTYTDDSKVTVEGLQGDDALTSVTLDGQERNVGEYTEKIVPSAAQIGESTGNYEIAYEAGKLTITPADLTITVYDQSYMYNGKTQGEGDTVYNDPAKIKAKVEAEGLQGDDELTSITLDGQEIYVGEYEEKIEASDAAVGEDGAENGNYNISYVFGKLTITKSTETFEITSSEQNWTYDAESHDYHEYTVKYGDDFEETVTLGEGEDSVSVTLPTGDVVTITPDPEANVEHVMDGEMPNAFTFTISNDDMEDSSTQFEPVEPEFGALTISPREIDVTVGDKSVKYNGKEQEGDTEYTFTNLVGGAIAEIDYTPSKGTLVGVYDNGSFDLDSLVVKLPVTDQQTGSLRGMKAERAVIKDGDVTGDYVIGKTTAGKLDINDDEDEDGPVDPSLVVTKEVDSKKYDLGETIKFTVTAKNIYNETKTITLTEIKGVTLEQDVFKNVGPGETVETTATYVVKEADILAGSFTNTVKASFSDEDLEAEAEATANTADKNSHLTVEKEATSKPANGKAYAEGEKITWKVTVTNDGNVTIKNITVTDELTGDEWTVEALKPGASKSFTAEYTVTAEDMEAGSVTNTATATGEDPDGDEPGSDPGTDEQKTQEPGGHVTIKKVATSKPKNGKAYDKGEVITWKITVKNDGNVEVTDITVTDKLTGDKWTIDSLQPGESKEFTAKYTVTEADKKAGYVENVADATGKVPGGGEPDVVPGKDRQPVVPENKVQTGDDTNMWLWTILMAASTVSMGAIMLTAKKRRFEEE